MRSFLFAGLAAIALLVGQVVAQTPTGVTYFGDACTASANKPQIAVHGSLSLGGTFSISLRTIGYEHNHLTAYWDKRPVLLSGFGQIAVPVPTHLFPNQPAGCTLLVDPIHFIYMQPNPDPNVFAYDYYVVLTIPNNSNLIGMSFTSQWASIYNALVPNQPPNVRQIDWIVFTDAATMTVQP